MNVRIDLFGPFRDVAGEKTLEVSVAADATVRDALAAAADDVPDLDAEFFDDGTLVQSMTVTRNGRSIRLDEGAETPLDAGDTLRVSPPIHGG
jgi:molybdopterin synthase sulfur carrier subunit